jgi:ABC-type transport system substrate-binding protein
LPLVFPVETVDPAIGLTTWHAEVISSIFETLMQVDDEGRIVPLLAESLIPEAGGRAYRFRLREGIRFHDGRPLTARDVRFSFDRVKRRADKAIAVFLGELQNVQVISDSEGVFELGTPHAAFPAALTYSAFEILPEGTEEIGNDWQHGAVGTGPFRLVKFQPRRRVELEANPHYWRAGLPRVERFIMTLGVPEDEIASRFLAGRCSLAIGLTGESYRRVRRECNPGSHSASGATFGTCFLAFNGRSGPLRDKGLRQRLVAAVDVPSIIQQHFGATAIVATSFIPPGILGHNPKRWPVREVTEIRGPLPALRGAMYTVFAIGYQNVSRDIAAAFRRAGFQIDLRPTLDPLSRQNADIYFYRWVADFPDADGFITGALHSESGVIGHLCGSSEIDSLIDRGRQETDPALRSEIYREIDDILMREALVLPLFHEQMWCFAQPEIDGFAVRRFHPFLPFEQMSVR